MYLHLNVGTVVTSRFLVDAANPGWGHSRIQGLHAQIGCFDSLSQLMMAMAC